MKNIAQSLTLGLAVLAASATAPRAADWAVGSGGVIKDYGSIRDYRNAAVPVPSPIPAPRDATAEYYVRGDLGYTIATSADITATGGITANSGETLNNFLFGSVGAGRYITPSLRGEISFDFRPKKTVASGPQYFSTTLTQKNVSTPTSTDVMNFAVTQTEVGATQDHTVFLSLYYDLRPVGRFTPYVGAGLGIDSKRFKRTMTQNATCTGGTTTDSFGVTISYDDTNCSAITWRTQTTGFTGDHYASSLGLAAAFMLGAGYQISNGVTLDAGYRLLWEGAQVSSSGTGINGATNISISSRFDHEIRSGVRIDLN